MVSAHILRLSTNELGGSLMEYLRRKTDAGDRRGVVERLAHANERGVSLALAPHEVAMVMSLPHVSVVYYDRPCDGVGARVTSDPDARRRRISIDRHRPSERYGAPGAGSGGGA